MIALHDTLFIPNCYSIIQSKGKSWSRAQVYLSTGDSWASRQQFGPGAANFSIKQLPVGLNKIEASRRSDFGWSKQIVHQKLKLCTWEETSKMQNAKKRQIKAKLGILSEKKKGKKKMTAKSNGAGCLAQVQWGVSVLFFFAVCGRGWALAYMYI